MYEYYIIRIKFSSIGDIDHPQNIIEIWLENPDGKKIPTRMDNYMMTIILQQFPDGTHVTGDFNYSDPIRPISLWKV